MNQVDLNRAIRSVVALCTGLNRADVRPANQDAPAKGGTYATVLITSTLKAGQDQKRWNNIDGDPDHKVRETVGGQRLCSASVQFFRDGAHDLASKLETRIHMTDALALMQQKGIGFIGVSAIRTLSAVVNSAWESRAQIDIDFYSVVTEVADVPTYGHFPIEVQTRPKQSEPPVNQSNEVSEP